MANTWDPVNKGPDVVLSNGNLTANITGLEEWVRTTYGRDPAGGGVWQWEISVPGGSGAFNVRPGFGMVDALADCTVTSTLLGSTVHSWGFRTSPPGDGTPSDVYHNGSAGDTWTDQIGGTAFIAGLVWDAMNKTLTIFQDGVSKYTLSTSSPSPTGSPVGTDGIWMFPAFASYSLAPPGVMGELGTVNLDGPFAHPVGGALPFGPPSSPGQFFLGS